MKLKELLKESTSEIVTVNVKVTGGALVGGNEAHYVVEFEFYPEDHDWSDGELIKGRSSGLEAAPGISEEDIIDIAQEAAYEYSSAKTQIHGDEGVKYTLHASVK